MEYSAMSFLAGAAVAAMIGGCASGGGSKGTATYSDGTTSEITLMEMLGCILTAGLGCPRSEGGTASTSSLAASASSPQPFVRWPDHRGAIASAASSDLTVGYERGGAGTVRLGSGEAREASGTALYSSLTGGAYGALPYWQNQQARVYMSGDPPQGLPGQPGLAAAHEGVDFGGLTPPFIDRADPLVPDVNRRYEVQTIAVVGDPYALGWDYQSFGIWASAASGGGMLGASSFGAPTPAAGVPLSGAATFSGKLAGHHVSPTGLGSVATANLRVAADFSNRTLAFASSGTTLTRNLSTAVPAPNLDIRGTLSYAQRASAFSGTLSNTGGTMSGLSNGRFYGPAAQELGGTFALRSSTSSEAFIGAYGAKR